MATFPAPVPFSGKPRRPDGSIVDWVALHLAPPLAAQPWLPVLYVAIWALESFDAGLRNFHYWSSIRNILSGV
jgi:hypothetical protein